MRKNLKFEETLCSNNASVKDGFIKLRARLKKIGVEDKGIYALIDECRDTLKVMKRQGQKLEDRCRKYRNAIESCGFIRK